MTASTTPEPFGRPAGGEPFLLTPGPLTTALSVKQAMLKDWGSWDADFRAMTASLRAQLLALAGATDETHVCVPIQGSGTYAVEAMLGTCLPRASKTLVLSNGAYGKRMAEILRYIGRDHAVIDKGDYMPPRGREVEAAIAADPAITHVAVVHCETSSGILNPLSEIAEAVNRAGRRLLVDSMSAFGAVPLDVNELGCDAFVSSANKCIEGVPGFGFVVMKRDVMTASKGNAHSLSLDLHAQWDYMEKSGQWRYTPPTHSVAAFLKALDIHAAEGGVTGRGARYAANRDVLVAGMRGLGFETLLDDTWLSPIIVTFFTPANPAFGFSEFYERMKAKGFIIYPGKLTVADSFRVGCIGRMDAAIMRDVVAAAGRSLTEMGVRSAAPSPAALSERAKLAA